MYEGRSRDAWWPIGSLIAVVASANSKKKFTDRDVIPWQFRDGSPGV